MEQIQNELHMKVQSDWLRLRWRTLTGRAGPKPPNRKEALNIPAKSMKGKEQLLFYSGTSGRTFTRQRRGK